MIHGDFWFSNIILTYDDKYKIIDMRGQVDNKLTINGDIYYDYGKLYQSILGYDLLLNNESIDDEYINTMKNYFLEKCENINLNLTERQTVRLQRKELPSDILQLKNEVKEIKDKVNKILELMN